MSTNRHNESAAPLLSHLRELRKRLLIVLAVFVTGACAVLPFVGDVYLWLETPLLKALPAASRFITLSPLEGWLVYFKIAAIAALFITSPVWLYEFWAFVSPGLYKKERAALVLVGIASALLFVGGAALCYFLVVPYGFEYLVSILNGSGVILMPQMEKYFSFMLGMLVAFGIVFEIPIVVVFLVRWNVVSLRAIKKARPYVIVGAFILAAVLTPTPDAFCQIALAVPFIILFEISLLVARVLQKKPVTSNK